jgi:hypothetical protein
MQIKTLVLSAALVSIAAPAAFADYYIVQGPDKHCQIVDQRPTTKEMTVIGPDGMYRTRTEAETAMKTVKVCESR